MSKMSRKYFYSLSLTYLISTIYVDASRDISFILTVTMRHDKDNDS